ncbi:MAG: hypothetical protein ACLVC1_12975 [Mediterraneibacter gnavus]
MGPLAGIGDSLIRAGDTACDRDGNCGGAVHERESVWDRNTRSS